MEETRNDQKGDREEVVRKMLTSLVQKAIEDKSIIYDSAIDPSKYGEADIASLTTAKTLTKFVSDPELLEIISKNNGHEQEGLLSAIVAEAFLREHPSTKLREDIISLAKLGDYGGIIKLVGVEAAGKITPEELGKIIEARMPKMLAGEVEATKGEKYTYEKLSGQLGKGARLTLDHMVYEHRDIDSNTSLRIIKTYDKYQVILHQKEIKGKTSYDSYKKLLNAANSVFGLKQEISLDRFVEEAIRKQEVKKDGAFKIQKVERKDSGVSVIYNKDHNFFYRNDNLKGADNWMTFDAGLVIIPAGIGILTIIGGAINWAVNKDPHVFYFGAGLLGPGISDLALGAIFYQNLLFYGIAKKNKEDSMMKRFFNGTTSIDSYRRSIENYKKNALKATDMDELGRLKNSANSARDRMASTFEYLKDVKGFSVTFESFSLDDIYMKAYQLKEAISK